MAWKVTWSVGERRRLVEMVLVSGVSVVEAARLFGQSNRTAHKWLKRAKRLGIEEGLKDQSRARLSQKRFEGTALDSLLELRRKHPRWGPVTLLYWLKKKRPAVEWPAASTVGEILRREGLIIPRRRLPSHGPIFRPGHSVPSQPNDRWTMDFKGHFRLLDGTLCYPFTLRDAFSRMVLRIDACPRETCELVLPLLKAAFREHGMPLELHSDTGAPFGSTGLGRLSVISVFALKLGIRPLFSRPGKPQDNGGHERMHLDVKAETTRPPGGHTAQQQQMFDEFRECFDFERPHHALNGATPASLWGRSPRQFPACVESPTYAAHWETRWVDSAGYIKWNDQRIFVGSAMRHEPIGIEPFDEGLWRIHFATLHIGMLQTIGGRRKKTVVIGR